MSDYEVTLVNDNSMLPIPCLGNIADKTTVSVHSPARPKSYRDTVDTKQARVLRQIQGARG